MAARSSRGRPLRAGGRVEEGEKGGDKWAIDGAAAYCTLAPPRHRGLRTSSGTQALSQGSPLPTARTQRARSHYSGAKAGHAGGGAGRVQYAGRGVRWACRTGAAALLTHAARATLWGAAVESSAMEPSFGLPCTRHDRHAAPGALRARVGSQSRHNLWAGSIELCECSLRRDRGTESS